MLTAFDHVNLRTARLDEMVSWYDRVLGLAAGPRAPFDFPGAWLYLGDHAVIHLVGVQTPPAGEDPRIEHFAFAATGLARFTERLDALGVPYERALVPGGGPLQINLHDPDGNHIHIDFDVAEA